MHLSFYSCLVATIASTAMIIVVYCLKKSKYFANTFGVWYMALLYLFSFIRLLVPFEFDKAQIVGDSLMLPKVMDVLENRSVLTAHLPCSMLSIFGSVSLVVSFVLIFLFFFRQFRFVYLLAKTENFATQEEQEMLNKISRDVFLRGMQIKLIKSNNVSTPMVVGVLKNTVVIPNREYTGDELQLVLYHECTHLKNHDLLLKLLLRIYCCVFWFNPFVYLLKADMDFIVEVKCDTAVCRKLSVEKKLDYAKLVNDNARSCVKSKKHFALINSGFSSVSTSRHICRMNNLLYPNSKGPALPIAMISFLMVAIFLLSYAFVLQPDYSENVKGVLSPSVSNTELADGYLVPDKSGDYYLCVGEGKILVNKEDVEKGYYKNYSLIDM